MKLKTRRIVTIVGLTICLLAGFCVLQAAFLNVGQEFGAYGQYYRVLRVIRSMDDYTVVSHSVRRKLELANLFHVEEFSVKLRGKDGQVGVISFKKETDEMKQRDEGALRAIVRDKYQRSIGSQPP